MRDHLYSPFGQDIPNAFTYNDSFTGRTLYCGPNFLTIKSFAESFHYELHLDFVDSVPKKSVLLDQIVEGQYNLSLHGVLVRTPAEDPLANITQYSYPIEVLNLCVMVPLAPELPKWMYMIWPLGRYIWTTLFLSIFYVAFLLRYVHYQEPASRSYTRNLLHALGIIMYSPNMNMPMQMYKPPLRMFIFYTLLYLLGFIITNYHISHMTTFDLKPVFRKPIDSWSDLVESKVPIIIAAPVLDELRSLPTVNISSLEKQFRPQTEQILVQPSREHAYVVSQDEWEFWDRQQRDLIQPYFHLSKVCFGGLFSAFPIPKNVVFADQLNRFMRYIEQSGLWGHWEDMGFLFAVRANYAQILLDEYPVEPLNLEFFSTAWIVLVCGSLLSLVCFCLELFWRRWTPMRSYSLMNASESELT